MGAHFNPGLLTLKAVSHVAGLDVLDHESGTWLNVESAANPTEDLLIFTGETLELVTEGEYKACSHRGHSEGEARVSVVYEMRSHHVC